MDLAQASLESDLPWNLSLPGLTGAESTTSSQRRAWRPHVTTGRLGPHTLVWTQSQREALREQYGTEEAQDLITRTTGFVQRSPRLQKLIEKGALGSHPEFVALLVERVLSAACVAFGQPSPDGDTDAAAASAS